MDRFEFAWPAAVRYVCEAIALCVVFGGIGVILAWRA
jgi:hypothetical protein